MRVYEGLIKDYQGFWGDMSMTTYMYLVYESLQGDLYEYDYVCIYVYGL